MKKVEYIFYISICFYAHISIPKEIHIYGDSHALRYFASEKLSGSYVYEFSKHISIPIEIHWLGPKTMHSFGRDGLQALNIKHSQELDIVGGNVITKIGKIAHENDIIVFTLGEIDVRNHIGKQRDTKQRNIDEILTTLVENYFKTIQLNLAQLQRYSCIIVEVVPPIDEKQCTEKQPFYGSIQDRIDITQKLNAKLKNGCLTHNYIFLPTHDLYALPDGSLNPNLSDHVVHVAFEHNYLIRERLINTLIKHAIL